MKTYLAFYKKPSSKWHYKLFHYATCVWTLSRYSHVELVIDGVAYSSSARDGGVRSKIIPDINNSGRWDIFEIEIDKEHALSVFNARQTNKYDFLGVARHVLPFIPNIKNRDYCSEIVADMLWLVDTERTPEDIFRHAIVDGIRKSIPNEIVNEEL